jgi:2-oxoglutarate ferredoxin oxidoreductase subunit beta
MATTPTSTPAPKTNRIGLPVIEYRGGKTSSVPFGHCYIAPHHHAMLKLYLRVMTKFSGSDVIQEPRYFRAALTALLRSWTHALGCDRSQLLEPHRIASSQRRGGSNLIGIGVRSPRRRTSMIHIIEDSGAYGLTKGQFSATADVGSN